jgi:hypothetical protein
MPLFTPRPQQKKRSGKSLSSRLKRLLHRKHTPSTYGSVGENLASITAQKFMYMIVRFAIVTVSGVAWFIASTELFLTFLPKFAFWETLISNIGTTDANAYFFFLWVPEILLFVIGTFWMMGLFEIITGSEPLQDIF